MGKDRLAAFSDGVIAIIITIMVLELKCRMAQVGQRLWRNSEFHHYVLNLFISRSIGTIIPILFTPSRALTVLSFGQTPICCSGSLLSRPQPRGWARTFWLLCPPRCTA